ncbi:RagB/SusD family nutrient uptake outer membrane protein [Chitinophaga sp. 22321]|uniref:RagB/SusD family nutrient uptake outer membrane protein n=1 Tax=Chitinophaga hostae TaxID=2831022 RepID=A0ABS5J5M5_9BACT|nr:RagB/SusD family nutrient uptake outer membrane protein [Chitinophaga hostae]MBS0030479.1 RagB/SusD family nutrient uptake outer membrane protein [Chitinophaga hostae]
MKTSDTTKYTPVFRRHLPALLLCLLLVQFTACKKFLDVVPDNVATIDNAFTMRAEAEKYLFTCYSYLPSSANVGSNPALLAGDEYWMMRPYSSSEEPWQIAQGFLSANIIYMSQWSINYKALRDCNIFLDNIHKVVDMRQGEKDRWIAEVKFLKAYYHWILLRTYGPIPIIDKNLSISSTAEETKVPRVHVDTVFNYISHLLDTAAAGLPDIIADRSTELGRMTKSIALAIKARVLVTAASPLFNGNPDYTGYKNYDGTPMFNPAFDAGKWKVAAEACKAAITHCESVGIQLYTFGELGVTLSDTLTRQMSLRNATCEQWNAEMIWNNPNTSTYDIQRQMMPRLDPARLGNESTLGSIAPTMKMAEMFYTDKGVPINEDKTWDFANRTQLRTATHAEGELIQEGYTTASLHFNREPRFYADLGFDGAMWRMEKKMFHIESKAGQWQTRKNIYDNNVTGYFCKKMVSWKNEIPEGQGLYVEQYAWPEMRLADLYLLYAEALNEQSGPQEEAFKYIDKVRARAGLPTVQTSWTNYSKQPGKFQTKEGFRQIIQQERLIELAFEGARFWDLRRWKKSMEELNKPVTGWDVDQSDPNFYYRVRTLFRQTFQVRNYFWPLDNWDLLNNPKLVQSFGW